MNDAVRYAAAHAWFDRLVSLAPAEQAAGLAAIPDPAIRADVEALLRADADPRDVEPLRAPPPERIGTFRVVRELGRGGMGVVYEAEEHAPRRRVALKLLHPWLRSPALDELARREAQALADTPHPGIPSVYALLDDERGPVVIMELVEGEPFEAALVGRPRTERLELLAKVADAIAYAHARGVVHRDLKPQNLILAAEGQPKVLDFGLAHTHDAPAAKGGGTPAYVAPEQARGEPATPAADLYSLGVLSRELLPAARAGEPGGRALREDEAAVLARATANAPADRYPDVATFAAELRRLAEDRPVLALPGWGPRLRALVRRHPRRLVGGVVGLGLVACLPLLPGAFADQRAAWTLRGLRAEAARGAPGVDDRLLGLLREPDLLASPAVADGWRWVAERSTDPETRLEALAAAWVYTRSPSPAQSVALAEALRDDGDVAAADAVDGTRTADPLQAWDFAGAAVTAPPALAGALRALGVSTPEPDLVAAAALDPDGTWTPVGHGVQDPSGRTWALPGEPADVALLHRRAAEPLPLVAIRLDAPGLYALGDPVVAWAPGTVAQALPVRRVETADLDGDGDDEVIVAATGWGGHELRVYAADGRLRARARYAAWDVAVTTDRTLWVLGGDVPDGSAPRGERRTLLPLRLEGDGLVPGTPVPLDRDTFGVSAADLDGDGHDELVLTRDDSFGVYAGGVAAWVPGLALRRREQADGDAAIELRVSDGTHDRVLGAGTAALPARVPPALTPATPPPALGEPRLLDAWARAGALARLGAAEPVLDRLLDLARASGRSADLRADALALVLPPTDTERPALTPFATALLALDPTVPPDDRTRLLLREVHPFDTGEALALPAPTDTLTFRTPLPAWLEVGRAGTVQRDPLGGGLAIDATPGDGVLLRATVVPDGDTLCVDVHVDLAELDWAAGLTVAVSDGRSEAKTLLWRTGGGPRAGHHLTLSGPGERAGERRPLTLGAHRVSVCVTSGPDRASGRLDDAPRHVTRVGVPELGAPVTLELRAPPQADEPSRRLRGDLDRIDLRGGHFDHTARPPTPEWTFAETGGGATDPRGRALGAASAGHVDAAGLDGLSELDVAWLLRHDAARWVPAAAASPADRFGRELTAAWGTPAYYRDPWAAGVLRLDALRGLRTDTPALQELALRRAEVLLEARELVEARGLLDAIAADAPGAAALRARLAVRSGHPEAVLPLLRAAMAVSLAPEAVRDAFADDPELAPLVTAAPAAPVLSSSSP